MALALKNYERTGKIVQAAAQLFARQGYHGISTREIAHLTDISEDTLFRYFEHKEDLFWSALEGSLQWGAVAQGSSGRNC
jgi:AcrR family transcriptional regulator